VKGELIDITGVMEKPRGETPLPWAAPEGKSLTLEVDFGRSLRGEVLAPVSREALSRRMAAERALGR
jgi:hypothetical protein